MFLQVGDVENAKNAFAHAITVRPEEDWMPYVNLAQIVGSLDGISLYTKATEILIKQRASVFAEVLMLQAFQWNFKQRIFITLIVSSAFFLYAYIKFI